MKNNFQINPDLLNLVSWVVYQAAIGAGSSVIANRTMTFHADGTSSQGENPQGYTSVEGSFRWLEEVFQAHQELKGDQSELEAVIVWNAAEFLSWGDREAMMAYAVGKASLVPDFQRSMNKKGFMIGDKFPQAVQRWIDIRARCFYDLDQDDS